MRAALLLALLAVACGPRLAERDYEFRVTGTATQFTGMQLVTSGAASVSSSVSDSVPAVYQLRGTFVTMSIVNADSGSLRLEAHCDGKLIAYAETAVPHGQVTVSTPQRCVAVE